MGAMKIALVPISWNDALMPRLIAARTGWGMPPPPGVIPEVPGADQESVWDYHDSSEHFGSSLSVETGSSEPRRTLAELRPPEVRSGIENCGNCGSACLLCPSRSLATRSVNS